MQKKKTKSKSFTFIHYFHIKPIENEIELLQNQYSRVKSTIESYSFSSYFVELDNFNRALLYQLKSVEQKFNAISPNKRIKRGLINGLGSIIKGITGNLDANDAKRYDQAIRDLEDNQKEVIQNLNKEISLTSKIIENFNGTVKFD